MIQVFEAAQQLETFCDGQGWRSCFIGGLAVQRWGEPRVTRDVDLTLLTGFGGEAPYVNALLREYRARTEDAAEFARRYRVLLLQAPGGVGLDVSLGALPFEELVVDRASRFEFAPGHAIRTCSAEDLIVLKLFASRPLDVQDAETVAIRQAHALDWRYVEEQLTPLAEAKEEPGILRTLERIRQLR